jgi:hypothetical protein
MSTTTTTTTTTTTRTKPSKAQLYKLVTDYDQTLLVTLIVAGVRLSPSFYDV